MSLSEFLAERGLIPDSLVRAALRSRFEHASRRYQQHREQHVKDKEALYDSLRSADIALDPDAANRQHYEVPPEFFRTVLGPWMKYSSCLWGEEVQTLADAEEAMLQRTCERAGLEDGMKVLDLGCGWGSLSLWISSHYPGCQVHAVSNSSLQKRFIESRAAELGLPIPRVQTADMNSYQPQESFDCILSIEMFEHMRNWTALLGRIRRWLHPGGSLFLHFFAHREFPFTYDGGRADWIAEHFFSGGLMPSADILAFLADDFSIRKQWKINGTEYARTLRSWLERLDENREQLMPVMEQTYGARQAAVWLRRWRLFFIGCEEFFAHEQGEAWFVRQALLQPQDT